MRRAAFLLAMVLASTCQAAQYPLGGKLETEMRSFDPKTYVPQGMYSFVKYMLEQQDLHDVGLHLSDFEIMLFDLPVPEDPQSQKAPQ